VRFQVTGRATSFWGLAVRQSAHWSNASPAYDAAATCRDWTVMTPSRAKNGPALAGPGAEAARDAITRTIVTPPQELRRSLTWDQGAEMAQHAALNRLRHPSLLLRSSEPLAAQHQREHQWVAAPVLPEGRT
jgi:hypothetical protein